MHKQEIIMSLPVPAKTLVHVKLEKCQIKLSAALYLYNWNRFRNWIMWKAAIFVYVIIFSMPMILGPVISRRVLHWSSLATTFVTVQMTYTTVSTWSTRRSVSGAIVWSRIRRKRPISRCHRTGTRLVTSYKPIPMWSVVKATRVWNRSIR